MGALGYKIKLWMINEKKEAVFGDGLAELIEEIDKYHSILAAAEHMGMSYRYALHRITLAEERLGAIAGYTSSRRSQGWWIFGSY